MSDLDISIMWHQNQWSVHIFIFMSALGADCLIICAFQGFFLMYYFFAASGSGSAIGHNVM